MDKSNERLLIIGIIVVVLVVAIVAVVALSGNKGPTTYTGMPSGNPSGGSPASSTPAPPTCQQVPYTEQECLQVPYTETVCHELPYTDTECHDQNLVYKQVGRTDPSFNSIADAWKCGIVDDCYHVQSYVYNLDTQTGNFYIKMVVKTTEGELTHEAGATIIPNNYYLFEHNFKAGSNVQSYSVTVTPPQKQVCENVVKTRQQCEDETRYREECNDVTKYREECS